MTILTVLFGFGSALSWLIFMQICFVLFVIAAASTMLGKLSTAAVKGATTEARLNALINKLGSGGAPAIVDQSLATPPAGQSLASTPGNIGAAGAYTTAYAQAQSDRINDLQGNINGDLNAAINRINDLIGNVSGDVNAAINRVNDILDVLRSAGMVN